LAKKISIISVFATLALIFSYIERLIPLDIGVPGVKLGLANIIVIIALYTIGTKYAFGINLFRIFVGGLLFSGVFAIAYGLAGGLLSFVVMYLLKKTNRFSIVGVSMAGGVFHNIGQILMAALVIANVKIMLYMPVLIISGLITGILIGILAYNLEKPLQKILKQI
jgi:heptaprenyl diphosphate synthase